MVPCAQLSGCGLHLLMTLFYPVAAGPSILIRTFGFEFHAPRKSPCPPTRYFCAVQQRGLVK